VTWDDDIAAAAATMIETVGLAATYTHEGAETGTYAIVRHDVTPQPIEFSAQLRAHEVRLDMLVEDVGGVDSVVRGDTVEVGGSTYTVDRVEADNGTIITVIATEDST
jgi:hypothetical protein